MIYLGDCLYFSGQIEKGANIIDINLFILFHPSLEHIENCTLKYKYTFVDIHKYS